MGLKLGFVPEKSFKRKMSLIAVFSSITLALSGCASIPNSDPVSKVDYRACLITQTKTDSVGVNDVADYAIKQAVVTYGVKRAVAKTSIENFSGTSRKLINQGCKLIVVSGSDFESRLMSVAEANSNVNFLFLTNSFADSDIPENVMVTEVDEFEAGFLIGHLAASVAENHRVRLACTTASKASLIDGIRQGISQFDSDFGTETLLIRSTTAADVQLVLGCPDEVSEDGSKSLLVGFGRDLYFKDELAQYRSQIVGTLVPQINSQILEVISADLDGVFSGGQMATKTLEFGDGGIQLSVEHEVSYPAGELSLLDELAQLYEQEKGNQ